MRRILLITLPLFLLLNSCTKESSKKQLTSNLKNTGESANELLSAQNFNYLILEINYVEGFKLNNTSVANLTSFLIGLINKPKGIFVVQKAIPTIGKASLTLNEILDLEKNYRSAFSRGDTLTVHILISDGAYKENNVLGIAYLNTSLVLFGKTIADNSGSFGQTSTVKLETAVLEHEFGHLLGLVDLGSAMQVKHKDQDPSHGNHCDNTNCLMYYASETTDFLGSIVTGNIPTLDANCKADLKANGGK